MSESTSYLHKSQVLGIGFDLIGCEDVLNEIRGWIRRGERKYITHTSPYSVMLCRRDPELRAATNGAALTLPDGICVILAASLVGYRHRGRVPGPALMLRLCDWGREHGLRHFFYGGREGCGKALARRLTARYPGLKVVGVISPPFRPLTPEEEAIDVEKINSASPHILWVGLGSPKQENWMAKHVGALQCPAMIGVGAAFDFHSGCVPWAPPFIRRLGLEWVFRLAVDPKRMWRKDVLSALFVVRVLLQGRRHPPSITMLSSS